MMIDVIGRNIYAEWNKSECAKVGSVCVLCFARTGTVGGQLSQAVASQVCGATGGADKRRRTFVALQFGTATIVISGSLVRATICGATNISVEIADGQI